MLLVGYLLVAKSAGDGRATTPDAAVALDTFKMGSAGYMFERFVMLTYFAYIFWHALKNPKNYSFLTFWTLLVHILYFSIDKASPVAGAATRLLHGMSFVAAVAVLAAYSQMAVAGSLYWGSFYEWERQIGQAIGASIEPDWWMYLYLRKAYEHIWPVLALLIDARLNRAELQRCYRGCSRAFRTALALGGYLALGVTWEQTCQSKDSGADFFAHYALPPWFASARLLAPLGIDATGLAPDAVFSNGQKVIMLLVAAAAHWRIAGPLITKAKAS
jgi:hypothetical protein